MRLLYLVLSVMLGSLCRADTLTTTVVPNLGTPYWVAIRGHLTLEVRADLEALAEVEVISPSFCFSFIGCSAVTLQMQSILTQAGLEYYSETNQQVFTQDVRLDPYSPNAKENHARQVPVTVEASLPPNLDRIDQLSNTLNDVYNPPGRGLNIPVYVLDTGVNIGHEEFGGRASRVTGFKNEAPCSSTAHGSWVASIVAGSFYGVANQAKIYDMKLPTGSSCDFFTSDAAAALNYLLLNVDAPFIVVMSWSAPNTPAMNAILQDLNVKGAILINAAGNEGSGSLPCTRSPGSSGVTFSVGSVGVPGMARSSFSNYGGCIDSFAPGENIVGAGLSSSSSLVEGDGTSAACPMEAGRAAVLMAQLSLTTPNAVYSALNAYSQKNAVVNPGTGSPNRFCNFKGSVAPSPAPKPAPTTSTRSPATTTPATRAPTPPANFASRFSLLFT